MNTIFRNLGICFLLIFMSCGEKKDIATVKGTVSIKKSIPPTVPEILQDQIYRNILSQFEISYKDTDEDLATSCSIEELQNAELMAPCLCDANGRCSFSFKGTLGFSGTAKIKYKVTANNQDSNTGKLELNILPIGAADNDQWVKVEGKHELDKRDSFYVMKYEAKRPNALGHNMPISNDSDQFWVNISAFQASHACRSLGRGYDLLSEHEWMIMARDIEAIDENWSGKKVGLGALKYVRATRFSELPFRGPERSSEHNHKLSTGDVIFDLAGNHWEWIDWQGSLDDSGFNLGPGCKKEILEINSHKVCRAASHNMYWTHQNNPTSTIGSYNHEENRVGRFFGGDGRAARRGGDLATFAGLYALTLNENPGSNRTKTAFRCVYRPSKL